MRLHTGVYGHVRESALKVDSGRKIPCRIGESNLRQRRDGPMLYQLSYIPTPQTTYTHTRALTQTTRIRTQTTLTHTLFFCFFGTTVLSQRDFSQGKIGLLSPARGKPAAIESRYPTYGACWVFSCFHNPPNSDMDYGIFNVRTDVNACDCTRGCTDT